MGESQDSGATATTRVAGIAAGACFGLALAAFGAALEGYVQTVHPVALLGATGTPHAMAFNLLAYVVPGLLAGFVALRRRDTLPPGAGFPARLGWNFALLSALAFAAQGLLPLDPSEPDAGTGRLHAVAWGVWSIAFAAASAALAVDAMGARRLLSALAHVGAGALVFALAWRVGDAVPVAIAQRAACACWFAWVVAAAWPRVEAAPG